ncbi:hypothetical protein GCM10027174_45240 [Salinifilum aidingensis]
MAERIQVELVDDLDGSPAQYTVTFALDGATYEIDLNERHARELRALLDHYVRRARIPQTAKSRQKEQEDRRSRKVNRDLTEQIRGAARRTKERLSQEAEPGDDAAGAESPEQGETAVEGLLNLSGSSAPSAQAEDSSAEEAAVADDAGSDAEPDESESDSRVPAVVMPQFSSAE